MMTYLTFMRVSLISLTVLFFVQCSKEEIYKGELPPMAEDVTIQIPPPQPLAPEVIDKVMLLDLVNEVRKKGCKCGGVDFPPATPIVWSKKLEDAAKQHTDDMNNHMFLSHKGSDGSNAGDRLKDSGYKFSTYGENLAVGITNEQRVLDAWLYSPGHCRIVMNSRYKEMGVATAGPFWSQVFATPM